jgi:hypothetical protein
MKTITGARSRTPILGARRMARTLAAAVLMEFCEDPSDNNRVRSALIRAPECPPAERVISVLSGIASSSTGGERKIVMRLLKAWQAS